MNNCRLINCFNSYKDENAMFSFTKATLDSQGINAID